MCARESELTEIVCVCVCASKCVWEKTLLAVKSKGRRSEKDEKSHSKQSKNVQG